MSDQQVDNVGFEPTHSIIVLNNAIRVMYQMGIQEETKPGYTNFIDTNSWLQPMESLGGRSLSQFMIGSQRIEKHLGLAIKNHKKSF